MKRIVSAVQAMMIMFLLIFLSQECLAGIAIEQIVKDLEGRASAVFLYLSENRFRSDHPEGGLSTIIDFKNDRMVMIDHGTKSYAEAKFSRWEKAVAERLKKDAPPIKPKARKIVVRKTGETAIINGFQTEKIEILADGEIVEEDWVTRHVNMAEIGKVMDRIAQGFSKEFRSEMEEGQEIYEKLKSYGFPILVKDYGVPYGPKGMEVLEVKKVESRELKEELFLPPSGYERMIIELPKK
ncbi:MAG: DUF4412 domain-containing protein [Thermodesulfobacteriota bacterium]